MDKFRTQGLGGLPLVLDDLRWFFGRLGTPNEGMYQAFNNLLRGFGDNFIVQGVVASGTTPNVAITEGWVILDGELIKVDAQTGIDTSTDNTFTKVTTFDSRGNKTFQNATIEGTYEKNRAEVSGTGGSLAFNSIPIFKTEKLLADSSIGLVNLRTKVIEIGDWDMSTDASIAVTHGFTAGFQLPNKIRSINVFIRADVGAPIYPLNSLVNPVTGVINGGVNIIGSVTITLSRTDGGVFDNAAWSNDSGFNRGFITIEHEL